MSAINPLRPEDSQGFDWDRSKNTPQINSFIDAVIAEAQGRGVDEEAILDQIYSDLAVVHEPTAAERIAEHTGHPEYLIADRIADFLTSRGHKLTSGDRIGIAAEVARTFG